MATTARGALAELKLAAKDGRLAPLLQHLDVEILTAFGSAVVPDENGETQFREPADLDIGVRFTGEPKVLELLDALTALTRYDHIDLAVITGNQPVLDETALCGIPLYERTDGLYATAQMAAIGHRMDTEYLRVMDVEAMRTGQGRRPG